MYAVFKHARPYAHSGEHAAQHVKKRQRESVSARKTHRARTEHTHRTHTDRAQVLNAQCAVHDPARSSAIVSPDQTTKSSCTNTAQKSVRRQSTRNCAVLYARHTTAHRPCLWPPPPVHRTHSRSVSFLRFDRLRRFVRRATNSEKSKIKTWYKNQTIIVSGTKT